MTASVMVPVGNRRASARAQSVERRLAQELEGMTPVEAKRALVVAGPQEPSLAGVARRAGGSFEGAGDLPDGSVGIALRVDWAWAPWAPRCVLGRVSQRPLRTTVVSSVDCHPTMAARLGGNSKRGA